MAKKHYLCVDLINPNTKENGTCYLANVDLRALYKYTVFCDGPDSLLDNLKFCDDKETKSLIEENLSKKVGRDTFYLKEENNEYSPSFKVLYKKDEDALYVKPSELVSILKRQFKIQDFEVFSEACPKVKREIYEYLVSELEFKKKIGIDKAFDIEEKIHDNFYIKYLMKENSDYVNTYFWQEVGMMDTNISLLVNYLCKDLHTSVKLAMMIKKAYPFKLVTKNELSKRQAFWNKRFKEDNKCYKYINEEISENVRNFVDMDNSANKKVKK